MRNESGEERAGSALDEVDKIRRGPTCTRILGKEMLQHLNFVHESLELPAIMISGTSATMSDASLYSCTVDDPTFEKFPKGNGPECGRDHGSTLAIPCMGLDDRVIRITHRDLLIRPVEPAVS